MPNTLLGMTTVQPPIDLDRKSTRLNSSHSQISYAVFCLKKKTTANRRTSPVPQRDSLQSVLARAGYSTTGPGLWAGHGSVGSAASDTARVEAAIPTILRM